ncbi:hypothetical protein B0H14DRAFT_2344147 [Mycena olivaceomarginata]|nr:hypothetical protein B0H14DRAFT_2344147 [Mycena olivaceomarginata]
MPGILNLKFKGNKSFVAFSNLNDTESLTKTWKVCTKVASYLEQGQRLENLSWRLWHLQNLMVDTDNAKSKREFKKLSKCMGDKLDKEKGRPLTSLPAPHFTRTPSTDLLRARAAEKERTRDAGAQGPEHIIQRMQFTFAVEAPPASAGTTTTTTTNNGGTSTAGNANAGNTTTTAAASAGPTGATKRKRAQHDEHADANGDATGNENGRSVRLPSVFSTSFGPEALLSVSVRPAPSLAPRRGYGEGNGAEGRGRSADMRVARPTIELPLDELLNAEMEEEEHDHDAGMLGLHHSSNEESDSASASGSGSGRDEEELDEVFLSMLSLDTYFFVPPSPFPRPISLPLPVTFVPCLPLASSLSGQGMRPPADVPMHASASASAGGAGSASAGAGSGAGALLNSAPGGVKAECSNCGATHTPLWRRGLNDELNCNACGLYCKLHKRPRPKTMRNTGGGGEGRGQSVRAEAVDVMAQCYNCHTTATPLWRKDDEGKTVCNACGLYYKLHGSARPISMKSDVIRKRSRHDARRGGASASVSETPTASPGVSRRASPAPGGPASSASASAGRASPTLAPDSTTTHSYDAPSELSTALGPKPAYGHPYPYHEQYPDALPFASVDVGSELEGGNGGAQQQRANKRRRMSVDSASEPPSSAVSYGSYADGYTSASSQFSMEFPFSRFPNVGRGGGLRGGGGANAFWHPPMMVQGENANSSPGGFHPPMLPTAEEAPMDYLHPPMVLHNNNYHQDEESLNSWFMQGSGLHPPMLPGDEGQMMGMMGGAHPPMMIEDFYDSNGNMHY